ncbi:hypothetical protein M0R19_02625 [Candidatus Pacearchaeota archaeon]|jgi:hypothetical protein|nr:hypothetical protein [Candidatus Pacearchaeota archaeon]
MKLDKLISEFIEDTKVYTNIRKQQFKDSTVISADRANKRILYDNAQKYVIDNPLKLSLEILDFLKIFEDKAPMLFISNKEDETAGMINDKEREIFGLRLMKRNLFDITILNNRGILEYSLGLDEKTASLLISKSQRIFNEQEAILNLKKY